MNPRNILILFFLAIMFVFGFIAMQAYNKVQEQKKENKFLSDSLQHQINRTYSLQKDYDSLFLYFQDCATTDTLKRVFDSLKSNSVAITRLNDPLTYRKAVELEKEGFTALANNQFDVALAKFTQAEKILPSYHMVFEISRYLRKSKSRFNDPAIGDQLKKTIMRQYSWGAPPEIMPRLKSQIN